MNAAAPAHFVMTVLGPLPAERLGVTDAHNHVWIDAVPGGDPAAPVLDQEAAIRKELEAYRRAGGGAIVDCQPGGCGRDGRRLAALARTSGVHLVACTGFHRRRYYTPGFDLWSLSADSAARRFVAELDGGLAETVETQVETKDIASLQKPHVPVRAGLIKVACEARLADTPREALEGAAAAAAASRAAVMAHTEKGAAAEDLLAFFSARGVEPRRLVFCHMDKRPDLGLHRELAQAGVQLEYDTFFRPKYEPETHLWPLIERMAGLGLDHCLGLGTDMADPAMWRAMGGAPGLDALLTVVRPRLYSIGLSQNAVECMLGGNIASRLAYPVSIDPKGLKGL